MDADLQEILDDFVVESKEHLEDIESELLLIEEKARANEPDLDLINRVFRAIHSIKGSAGFLGLTTIGDLSHSLESVLDRIRSDELDPVEEVVEVLLGAADCLSELIGDANSSNDKDVSDHVARLERVLEAGAVEVAAEPEATAEENAVVAGGEAAAPAPEPTLEPTRSEPSIRVPVSLLDSLMNLAGELVLGRNQLLQAVSTRNEKSLQYVSASLDQVTSDLQESVMRTRMQPIGNAFNRFPRVVRDLSRQLGKRSRLEVEGKDVELDKSLIEAVGDPLTHLVRNSVDHGIERPEARLAAGKPEEGCIRLRAFHEGGRVHVKISDDGAGIDPEKLRVLAVQKGLISQAEADLMGDREALDLIFAPGFSTAERVTDVSGRGVGMDVVRSNLESIGGSVQIDSALGRGTTITVHIPLTLAILTALVISCGKHRYAVPQANIRELVRVPSDQRDGRIRRLQGAEMLRLRGKLLPIVRLADIVGAEEDSSPARAQTVVVVDAGATRFGLLVASQLDAEEIVAKPLGRHFAKCGVVAGATILGDGRVAMILDVGGIANSVQLRASELAQESRSVPDRVATATESVVLFQNGTDYFGIPLGVVRRIELLNADEIRRVGGHDTYQRRGKVIPVVHVADHVTAVRVPDAGKYWTLVLEGSGRELGLLAESLEDVREVPMSLDEVTFAEPGVIGTILFEGHTVRLLDAGHFIERAFPHLSANDRSGSARRILLAEDTATYRAILAGYLSAGGYEVIACVDGQEAWEKLLELDFAVDAIVADIEMPRVDGRELARRVRAHERGVAVPLMAVSSLASSSDVEKGLEAGFDTYEVKLDRYTLLQSLGRVLELRQCASTT